MADQMAPAVAFCGCVPALPSYSLGGHRAWKHALAVPVEPFTIKAAECGGERDGFEAQPATSPLYHCCARLIVAGQTC